MIGFRDDDGSVFFLEANDIRMVHPRFDEQKDLDGSLLTVVLGAEVREIEVMNTPEQVVAMREEGEGCLSVSFIIADMDDDDEDCDE